MKAKKKQDVDHQFGLFGHQPPSKRIRMTDFEKKQALQAIRDKDQGKGLRVLGEFLERLERNI